MVGQRRGESAGGSNGSGGGAGPGRSSIRAAFARAAVVALAIVAVACIDTTTPQYFNNGGFNNGVGGGGGGGGQLDSNLVGSWSETIVDTVAGDPTNQQTIWQFNADGTASRTVITFDITTSVSDTTISNGTWTADGSTVSITFQAPNPGTEQFTYVINGSTLLLGQTEFVRTG